MKRRTLFIWFLASPLAAGISASEPQEQESPFKKAFSEGYFYKEEGNVHYIEPTLGPFQLTYEGRLTEYAINRLRLHGIKV